MRFIGMDVHRDFCQVAILDGEQITDMPPIPSSRDTLDAFGQSLLTDDVVVLENSGISRAIATILREHVTVQVANAVLVRAIGYAKIKTDRIDARMLARLAAANMIPEVDYGDEQTRALRRRVSRRVALIRQRSAVKNEVHAVLVRTLAGRPPCTDAFTRRGRAWMQSLPLPDDEQDTLNGCLRQIDAINEEIKRIDDAIARSVVDNQDVRRLMSIPGIDVTIAAGLIAAIGCIDRFPTPQKLVSYLGLNPTVYQSGVKAARMGHISKTGSSTARWLLTEAAHGCVKSPGPLRAFYQRIQRRRGTAIAKVATARKITVLAWHLLTRQTDYAFARPMLTRNKIRKLELAAGATPQKGLRKGTIAWPSKSQRRAERQLAEQTEVAYQRMITDWTASRPKTKEVRTPPTGHA